MPEAPNSATGICHWSDGCTTACIYFYYTSNAVQYSNMNVVQWH